MEKSREELEQELLELEKAYSSLQLLYEEGLAERRLALAGLRESERRFSQVAESAGEWIWEVDTDGLYTFSSPVVEEMLGYTPDEIVGKKHFYELFNSENRRRQSEGPCSFLLRSNPSRNL